MKSLFKFFSILLLAINSSCHTQQMVKKTSDAKKLEINQDKFVGKPLKLLLDQIAPEIKFVYGNPDNTWAGAVGGTYLRFHFFSRDEYGEKLNKNEKPLGIVVSFRLDPNNKHKPLPKGGLTKWTKEQTKEYGDMIIMKVQVTGGN